MRRLENLLFSSFLSVNMARAAEILEPFEFLWQFQRSMSDLCDLLPFNLNFQVLSAYHRLSAALPSALPAKCSSAPLLLPAICCNPNSMCPIMTGSLSPSWTGRVRQVKQDTLHLNHGTLCCCWQIAVIFRQEAVSWNRLYFHYLLRQDCYFA